MPRQPTLQHGGRAGSTTLAHGPEACWWGLPCICWGRAALLWRGLTAHAPWAGWVPARVHARLVVRVACKCEQGRRIGRQVLAGHPCGQQEREREHARLQRGGCHTMQRKSARARRSQIAHTSCDHAKHGQGRGQRSPGRPASRRPSSTGPASARSMCRTATVTPGRMINHLVFLPAVSRV